MGKLAGAWDVHVTGCRPCATAAFAVLTSAAATAIAPSLAPFIHGYPLARRRLVVGDEQQVVIRRRRRGHAQLARRGATESGECLHSNERPVQPSALSTRGGARHAHEARVARALATSCPR